MFAMRSGFIRLSSAAALGIAALTLASAADARGFVGIGIGIPLYYPPPVIYAPPPAYYAPPPPVVYAPPAPAYYAPPAPAYYSPPAAAPASGQQCREYQSTAVIDGQPQPTVGTACLQPDGTWRIVK
jgi:hypothetical protein